MELKPQLLAPFHARHPEQRIAVTRTVRGIGQHFDGRGGWQASPAVRPCEAPEVR